MTLARPAARITLVVSRNRALAQLIAGAVAFALGFWGFSLSAPPDDWTGLVNTFFRTLQLITLNFPTEFEKGAPWQLQIARLALPLVALAATFNVFVASISRPLRLALIPRAKGHLIVVGETKLADEALRVLADKGRKIVVVDADIDDARRERLEALGLTVVEANPAEPATLDGLSVRNAAALLLTSVDDGDNLDRAMLALSAVRGRDPALAPLTLAVLLEAEALAGEMDAALDRVARRHRLRYRRLCPDREGLRLDLARWAPSLTKPDRDTPSHVLVVGLEGQWRQTVSQLILATQDHPRERPVLSFALAPDAAQALADWRADRPDLDLVARFEILPALGEAQNDEALAAWRGRCGLPHLAVALVEDEAALSTALALRRKGHPFGAAAAPLLVRRTRKDRLLAELAATGLSDRDLTRMGAFGGLVRAETIERLLDGTGDEVARAIHERYRETQRGVLAPDAPALAAWDDLPENLREANRAAAAHAPILFAAAGFTPGAEPTDAQLDVMARVEHRRWMADRIDRGWRYGPARDDDLRLHPSIRPYDDLAPAEQAKDRETVLTLIAAARPK